MQKTGRAYKIGDRHMGIPHMVFSKFINWNKPPYDTDTNIDKRFVFALLLALTEGEKLMKNDIPCEVMDFVQGIKSVLSFLRVFFSLNLIFLSF